MWWHRAPSNGICVINPILAADISSDIKRKIAAGTEQVRRHLTVVLLSKAGLLITYDPQSKLKFILLPPITRPAGHDLRMVLLPIRIRESPLSPPCLPLGDAAYRRDPDEGEDYGADGGVDSDLRANGEIGPALGGSLGWWTGQSLSDCGVASAKL